LAYTLPGDVRWASQSSSKNPKEVKFILPPMLARFNVTRMVSDHERSYTGYGPPKARADSVLEGKSALLSP
jgi:hypothetical protein